MLGIKRRKKLEGWALDVSGGDNPLPERSLRQRLADSNKLWLFSLIAVVLVAAIMILSAKRVVKEEVKYAEAPAAAPERFGDRAAYDSFAARFAKDASHSSSIISARFTRPGSFRMVMPGNVGADDIEYTAKNAAQRILYEFNHRVTIQVYVRSAVDGEDYLAATVRWEPEGFGFVVRLQDIGRSAP